MFRHPASHDSKKTKKLIFKFEYTEKMLYRFVFTFKPIFTR